MSHRPTNCCPATERRMSVCLRNTRLLCALCRKQTWKWAQWVWMDSENIEYTCLLFRFNAGQPCSGDLCVWISHRVPPRMLWLVRRKCLWSRLFAFFCLSLPCLPKADGKKPICPPYWPSFPFSGNWALWKFHSRLKSCDLPILKGITLSSRTQPLVFIFGFITGGPCSSTTSSEDLQRSRVSLIGFISEMLVLICERRAVHCSHSTDCVLYRFFL